MTDESLATIGRIGHSHCAFRPRVVRQPWALAAGTAITIVVQRPRAPFGKITSSLERAIVTAPAFPRTLGPTVMHKDEKTCELKINAE